MYNQMHAQHTNVLPGVLNNACDVFLRHLVSPLSSKRKRKRKEKKKKRNMVPQKNICQRTEISTSQLLQNNF